MKREDTHTEAALRAQRDAARDQVTALLGYTWDAAAHGYRL